MTDPDWQRLDPRMLLVHPVTELRRMVLPLVGIGVFGASQGGGPLVAIAALAIPVVIGVVRYLTTTYRIADGRVELQRGLVSRNRLSAPLDRVRTVDLTSPLVHRLLGLTTVTIGTGSVAGDDERISLDALSADQARALRVRLLGAAGEGHADAAGAESDLPGAADGEVVAASFEPRWLWYAPFTSAGLAIAGALVGVLAQATGSVELELRVSERDLDRLPLVIAGLVLGVLVLAVVLPVIGYLVTNWRLRLLRVGSTWRLTRGLLTLRETSIDVDRLAGVSLSDPPGLRVARGARLSAIVTGLDRSQSGAETLVPPAPAAVVRAAGGVVLGTERPLTDPLTPHGPAATRRRYVRALVPGGVVAAGPVALLAAGLWPWLLVVTVLVLVCASALAADRARSLGHALTDGYVVTRSGSLLRRREALAVEHVIGWTFRDTWFQRRAGLTTVSATTAGGRGAVHLLDVPGDTAVALADGATPGLVAPFLSHGHSA